MARNRYQLGRVEETGKRLKRWKGFYYSYYRLPDGTERRRHHGPILGDKAKMTKTAAKAKLREIIARETGPAKHVPVDCTLTWFWQNRYRPMKSPKWKESSRRKTE